MDIKPYLRRLSLTSTSGTYPSLHLREIYLLEGPVARYILLEMITINWWLE